MLLIYRSDPTFHLSQNKKDDQDRQNDFDVWIRRLETDGNCRLNWIGYIPDGPNLLEKSQK